VWQKFVSRGWLKSCRGSSQSITHRRQASAKPLARCQALASRDTEGHRNHAPGPPDAKHALRGFRGRATRSPNTPFEDSGRATRSGGKGTAAEKIAALQASGIEVAESPADMGQAVQRAIRKQRSSRTLRTMIESLERKHS